MPESSTSSHQPGSIRSRADFGRELTMLRTAGNLTVREVAAKVAVIGAHTTIGDWFAGRAFPSSTSQELFTKVLYVCGVERQDDIDSWMQAWRAARRTPGRRPVGPEPYRGLSCFQPSDADWFFGRDDLTAALLTRLAAHRSAGGGLQFVVGASGSGKSSLLRAGLIPALTADYIPASSTWPVVLFSPGAEPVASLDRHVPAERSPASGADGTTSGQLPLVVVIDQFEEVFTDCADERQRQEFIRRLRLLADRGALVVAGVRADFYAQVLSYPVLLDAVSESQLTVGPMSDAELREAITAPAAKAKIDLEEGLVDVLLHEIAPRRPGQPELSGAGALPLLAYALYATWSRSPHGKMTIACYREIGGIGDAVAASADRVYDGLDAAQRTLARHLFVNLVHVSTDTADTRRRVRVSDLSGSADADRRADMDNVVDRFVEERLLTIDTDTVEISHEALLSAWPTLRGWIDDDRTAIIVEQQLNTAAAVWRDDQRDPLALYRGSRLSMAQEWASRHTSALSPLAAEFLTAGVRYARRRSRRQQQLIALLTVLLLSSVAAAGYGFQQRHAAVVQRNQAISQLVAGRAQRLRDHDPALAMQLSLIAYRLSPSVEARSSLLDAPTAVTDTRMHAFVHAVQAAALNPRKTVLAATGLDGVIRLWDTTDPNHPPVADSTVTGSPHALYALAFSPDGQTLAVGGSDAVITLWDVREPHHPVAIGAPLSGPAATIYAIAFNPADGTLAAASADTHVWRWDLRDIRQPRPLGSLTGPTGPVQAVAFNPAGTILAAGSADGTVRLWRTDTGTAVQPLGPALQVTTSIIYALAFSPDGQTLASGTSDGAVQLWNVADPSAPITRSPALTGPTSWVNSIDFSPDGTRIAAGSSDKTVTIWDTATGRVTALLQHPDQVTAVSYGSGGRTLATASVDATVRLWQLPGPLLDGGTGPVFNAAFDHAGDILATATHNGTVQLWNTADPRHPTAIGPALPAQPAKLRYAGTVGIDRSGHIVAVGTRTGAIQLWNTTDPAAPVVRRPLLTGPTDLIQQVAFSADGQLLAAASNDGNIYLWNVSGAGQSAPVARMDAAGGLVQSITFSPIAPVLASADSDGITRLWNIADPHHPFAVGPPLGGFTGVAYNATFSPSDGTLAIGGADGTVRLWDVTDPGRPVAVGPPLRGPASYVDWVAFSPDGRYLAAASGDDTVWLWDMRDPHSPALYATLTRPAGSVYTLAFALSGGPLAAGGSDGVTRLWDIDPADVATWICANAGTPITRQEWAQYVPGVAYQPPCP